jgi:hypothetical protein
MRLLALLLAIGCSSSTGDIGLTPDASSGDADANTTVVGKASALAESLGRKKSFLIGMGNDLADNHDNDGAYTLGVTLDLHYAYLVGLKGEGGWTDWNANGTFVNILTDSASKHGVTPVFTLYSMAAWGEANVDVLKNDAYMKPYWEGAILLFERLGAYGKPAVVHFEPDFWAYLQQKSGGDATKIPVIVEKYAPACAGLGENGVGLGKCLVKLARAKPNVKFGFHASEWAGETPKTIAFLQSIGAGDGDMIVTETLDRDAGCFEAAVDPNCKRTGKFYWTDADFKNHLAWVKQISDGLKLPVLWWQMPFGVPSDTPGGTAGHYRDNRVKYLFEHVSEFVAAGGVGAVFGTGAANQTYITTDGDQFKNAVTGYYRSPTPL